MYRQIKGKIFFRIFYDTFAASAVTKFQAGDKQQKQLQRKGLPQIQIEPFMFGSLVVDEQLLEDYYASHSLEASKKIVDKAIQIEESKLPELYINESIKKQLQNQLNGKGYSVTSQMAGASSEMLPYNAYYKSLPDLVIRPARDTPGVIQLTVSSKSEDVKQQDTDESEDESNDAYLVSELKKSNKSGQHQLYAEAFNVAATSVAELITDGKMQSIGQVYVQDECRKGLISKLIVDFENNICRIEEDRESKLSHECYTIALSHL